MLALGWGRGSDRCCPGALATSQGREDLKERASPVGLLCAGLHGCSVGSEHSIPRQVWMRRLRSERGGYLPTSPSPESQRHQSLDPAVLWGHMASSPPRFLESTPGTGSQCDTGGGWTSPRDGPPDFLPGTTQAAWLLPRDAAGVGG